MLTPSRAVTAHGNMQQPAGRCSRCVTISLNLESTFVGGAYDYKNHSMLKLNHPCGRKCTAFHLSNEAPLCTWIFLCCLLLELSADILRQ